MDMSVIITIIGVLVALTNVIVEVTKKATWDKLPTNILALDRGRGPHPGGWFCLLPD